MFLTEMGQQPNQISAYARIAEQILPSRDHCNFDMFYTVVAKGSQFEFFRNMLGSRVNAANEPLRYPMAISLNVKEFQHAVLVIVWPDTDDSERCVQILDSSASFDDTGIIEDIVDTVLWPRLFPLPETWTSPPSQSIVRGCPTTQLLGGTCATWSVYYAMRALYCGSLRKFSDFLKRGALEIVHDARAFIAWLLDGPVMQGKLFMELRLEKRPFDARLLLEGMHWVEDNIDLDGIYELGKFCDARTVLRIMNEENRVRAVMRRALGADGLQELADVVGATLWGRDTVECSFNGSGVHGQCEKCDKDSFSTSDAVCLTSDMKLIPSNAILYQPRFLDAETVRIAFAAFVLLGSPAIAETIFDATVLGEAREFVTDSAEKIERFTDYLRDKGDLRQHRGSSKVAT